MFVINPDQSIHLTRGDIACIEVSAGMFENEDYTFQIGDVVRFKVFEKNRCDNIVLVKDVVVTEEALAVDISLVSSETRIGEIIHRPKDFWYELEINPDTAPRTIIGYDSSGPKIFRLYPEGDDS